MSLDEYIIRYDKCELELQPINLLTLRYKDVDSSIDNCYRSSYIIKYWLLVKNLIYLFDIYILWYNIFIIISIQNFQ